jgi:hypothetical protein
MARAFREKLTNKEIMDALETAAINKYRARNENGRGKTTIHLETLAVEPRMGCSEWLLKSLESGASDVKEEK